MNTIISFELYDMRKLYLLLSTTNYANDTNPCYKRIRVICVIRS